MEEPMNRVERDLLVWRSREERFETLFPGSLAGNRPFLTDKLLFLERLSLLYNKSENEDEQLTLRILNAEKRVIERKLYPNRLQRLFRRLWFYLTAPRRSGKLKSRINGNLTELKANVRKIGFKGLDRMIDREVALGKNTFHLPVSYYVTDTIRMDYQIHVIKEGNEKFLVKDYTASLYDERKPSELRKQTFVDEDGHWVNAKQAQKLLEGKAIALEEAGLMGSSVTVWKQLDFTDKDNNGNFRIKEFPPAYGFDLLQQLERLPFTEEIKDQITKALKMGEEEKVTVQLEGKSVDLFISADPQKRALYLKNQRGKRLDFGDLIREKINKSIRTRTPVTEKNDEVGKIIKLSRSRGKSI
jgi:hypothetical protein